MRKFATGLIAPRGVSPDAAESLARTLGEGRSAQDCPVTLEEAKSLGFPVALQEREWKRRSVLTRVIRG